VGNNSLNIGLDGKASILGHQLFEAIFDSPSNGMILLDSEFHILRIGKAVCEMLGYEPFELFGKLFHQLLQMDEWNAACVRLQSLATEPKKIYEAENKFIKKDGTVKWVIVSVSALAHEFQTAMPGYVLHVTSIAKQKQAELKAEEANAQWSFALDSAGQGLWDCEVLSDTWTYSSMWKEMRGIPQDEVVALDDANWIKEVHPDDHKLVLEKMSDRHRQGMGEVSYEYRQRHRDGHWMWVLARGKCVEFNADGSPKRVIGTDTDITAIKKREQELAETTQSLELALSTSQVGIWKYDAKNSQTYWDGRSREMFGLPLDSGPLEANTWEKLVHPEDLKNASEICKVNISARTDFSLDYRAILDNGQVRYIRCRASFPENRKNSDWVIGVMWDVTADIEKSEAFKMAKQLAENRTVDLEVARTHLEHASLHDALTGLPNRRHLDTALSKFQSGSKHGHSLSLLHVDLDRFKQINDTIGHAAGDAVLVQIASMLRNQFRGSDLVARIGGDEFVVLLSPSPDRRVLQQMVDRVIALARQPVMWQGHVCRCGVSIGIAESGGDIEPKQLFVNADIALYRAKNSGRNCAVYFTGGLQAEVIANKQCADDLLKATERNEFIPFYQPIFNAQTFEIAGVEALVRWQHPTRGLLGPDKFLHIAEEFNALDAIDRLVLEQSLADLRDWDGSNLAIPKVSVNVSARRLGSAVLLESLQKMNIAPGRISFELLESIFLDEDDDINSKNIDAIKKMGIGIDIDDFGTGHASIVSLLRLHPNRMKIDRQLVRHIVESDAQRKLVRSIIDIGKSQEIEVCAEGVETIEQARILASLGCDYLQGYYFAKPMSAQNLVGFVKAQSWRKNAPALQSNMVGSKALHVLLRKMNFARTN
jgi:diguanylate cyclase (GGDEF)-like protein/PAS domain S-box-containing protein